MSETPHPDSASDARPVVARATSNRGLWLFGAILVIAAAMLFASLEARRLSISSPATTAPLGADASLITSPPPLAIPAPFPTRTERAFPGETVLPGEPVTAYPPAQRAVQVAPRPRQPQPPLASAPEPAESKPPDPAYVFQARTTPSPGAAKRGAKEDDESRAFASAFRNPSTTVPQGAVIQAVLETALNSNHPGFARAIVSRDVYAFDGSRVLIHKGSKLFGEYGSDVSLGQNRALIRWRRLTRPDGTIIDVDSPTADPLGRAGVKGKVDSHFFSRFGGMILQSVLDLGVGLATREVAGDAVIVALPNSTQQIVTNRTEQVTPTLKVKHGTSVSVVVMRDLDFSDVEL